ncbi:hypothetical protein ABDD95_16005 [Mucilaginibacter sp. PAMB04274]|uniref:hypothetical protein n=1 Tax=Mucilaginibacter sp. PAMB04274 TaxID=3138568 RepID=UPI0031F6F368
MTDQQTLLKLLSARTASNWVNKLAKELETEGFVFTDLLNLTLHPDGKIAFRAVWLLDTLVTGNLSRYAPHLEMLVQYGVKATHHSCHRQYARIYVFLTSGKAPQDVKMMIAATDMEPVVERCFDWLIDKKAKVAVKAFASETLYNLHERYDWIAEELQSQLHYLMQNGSPAIQAKGRRLLKALQSNRMD